MEPEGFEPSSKQGNNKLSTCLVLFNFSVATAKRQSYYYLSSLSFACVSERYSDYPAIFDAPIGTPAGRASRGTLLVEFLLELSSKGVICFAVCVLRTEINEPLSQCSACLLTISTCCQNLSAPITESIIIYYKDTKTRGMLYDKLDFASLL